MFRHQHNILEINFHWKNILKIASDLCKKKKKKISAIEKIKMDTIMGTPTF